MSLKNWNSHPIEEIALRLFWDQRLLIIPLLAILFAMGGWGLPLLLALILHWALSRCRFSNPRHDEKIQELELKIEELCGQLQDRDIIIGKQCGIIYSLRPAADLTEKNYEIIEAMERLVLRHEQYAIALTPSLAENIKHIRRDENFPDLFYRMKPPGEKRKRKREQTKDIKFKKKP